MVAKDDPPIRRDEIPAVVQPNGGGGPLGVEGEHVRRDDFAVKPVRDGVAANRRNK
jgi:hypothetical protein